MNGHHITEAWFSVLCLLKQSKHANVFYTCIVEGKAGYDLFLPKMKTSFILVSWNFRKPRQ